MRRFSPYLLTAAALGASVLPAQRDDWTRVPEIRADRTIFSPLDLPTPNRLRTASGAPGPDYWQQKVDYRIDVALDPETRVVRGSEQITYHNQSPEPLDYLWVHLEQNVLRADSLGSLAGSGRAVGGASDPTDGISGLQVTTGGESLSHHVYDTMMRVDLPEPLASGGRFAFEIAWQFTVPERVFRRYGTQEVEKGIVWELAQWFPAVAVYDDVHGWNTLPYLGAGEFYTNFGTYDVSITVPRDHLVVATGLLQNEAEVYTATQLERLARAKQSEETVIIRDADEVGDPASRPAGEGPLTWRFHADDVRTFAWAASDAFILDAASLGDILVQSAYPEESLPVWGKSTQMLRAAMKGYSERWFPYPYPAATNVSGVEGGMEYPMIVFCRGSSEAPLWEVTTHEIGHNWFPMVVNTDERRHAWMDEGFNTFINTYSRADWFDRASHPPTGSFAGMMRRGVDVPIMTYADRLDGMRLGLLQYMKAGTGLRILREHVLGPERFDAAFRTYIRRWAFKSPRPADFFRTMEDAAGADLAWFWRGWFMEGASLDQGIDRVRQARGKRPARISFVNLGRMVMPLHFQVTFEDDTKQDYQLPVEIWYQSDRVTKSLDVKKRVRAVRIDARQAFPDRARRNNIWKSDQEFGESAPAGGGGGRDR
ncbi:MAG: M1 family metallopeptidase [Planctomycetota bacterium]